MLHINVSRKMNNINQSAVSRGFVNTLDGVECVRWGADTFSHGQFTAEEFEALCGNPTSFMGEWARNGYPLLCNGWMFHPVACHVEDDNRVFAVTFLVNNAIVPDLEFTYGVMTLASQNGIVTCEITNLSV